MVDLLPVFFFHCYAKKVDIETQQGSKSFQGEPWLIWMGTGFCRAIYHRVSEANEEVRSASLPAVEPAPLPPPLEEHILYLLRFHLCCDKSEVANALWCAVPLRWPGGLCPSSCSPASCLCPHWWSAVSCSHVKISCEQFTNWKSLWGCAHFQSKMLPHHSLPGQSSDQKIPFVSWISVFPFSAITCTSLQGTSLVAGKVFLKGIVSLFKSYISMTQIFILNKVVYCIT